MCSLHQDLQRDTSALTLSYVADQLKAHRKSLDDGATPDAFLEACGLGGNGLLPLETRLHFIMAIETVARAWTSNAGRRTAIDWIASELRRSEFVQAKREQQASP